MMEEGVKDSKEGRIEGDWFLIVLFHTELYCDLPSADLEQRLFMHSQFVSSTAGLSGLT